MKYIKKFELFEKGYNREYKNISGLDKINDFVIKKREIDSIIKNIKLDVTSLSYDKIKYVTDYDNDNNEFNLYFTLSDKSHNFLKDIINISMDIDSDKYYKIFDEDYEMGVPEYFLELSLKNNMNNKFDINNGLPKYLMGMGLGKKIYKKVIKDFNYMYSRGMDRPSIQSDMVWSKILKDDDCFSFIYDDNIISFWKDYPFDNIIDVLRKFYKNVNFDDSVIFDDTFKKVNKLTDTQIKDILFNE